MANYINDRFATKWFDKIFSNKQLAQVLDKFSYYSAQNSFHFIEKIKLIPLSKVKNSYMITYDIKILLTNIPVVEVIKICIFKD